jgi:hypothetical protein
MIFWRCLLFIARFNGISNAFRSYESEIFLSAFFFHVHIALFPLFSSIKCCIVFLFIWVWFSVDAMELPFLNAYLESVGVPNFRKGCNFAAAGSTILPATATSVCPFSFGIQVNQFLRFKARVLELLSKGMYVRSSLSYCKPLLRKTWLKVAWIQFDKT